VKLHALKQDRDVSGMHLFQLLHLKYVLSIPEFAHKEMLMLIQLYIERINIVIGHNQLKFMIKVYVKTLLNLLLMEKILVMLEML
jgi:hypothetical protein